MYKAYFTRRLLEALRLAKEASTPEERGIHLRASHYYRELLGMPTPGVSERPGSNDLPR